MGFLARLTDPDGLVHEPAPCHGVPASRRVGPCPERCTPLAARRETPRSGRALVHAYGAGAVAMKADPVQRTTRYLP